MKKIGCCLVAAFVLSGCQSLKSVDLRATLENKQGQKEVCEVYTYGVMEGVKESYEECKQNWINRGYTVVSEKNDI
jgi:hypothetical protein